MNAERLLAHYERIADAPDAIVQLRRFVLDLAVRGKLVPQDSRDEPASELVKQIAKEDLSQADLPNGWRRSTVGLLLDFQYGKGLKASERANEGTVPVYGSNGVVGFTEETLAIRPSIIVGRKGSAGALNLCNGPSWTTDVAYFVEAPAFIEIRFLLNALAALDLGKLGKGVKPGLSRSDAYRQIVCVPPLAEQRRIVAKVDELMALCDRLEAARAEREARRDRLAAASLARLNAPDPETFHDDVRFALDALPVFTTRPDQIKQLRQVILNLAVRGKLVPQDPTDEPASELLKRIALEKQRLARKGSTLGQKVVADINDDHVPFERATGWEWVGLGEIFLSSFYGPRFGAEEYSDHGIPTIRTTDMTDDGRIVLRSPPKVRVPNQRVNDFKCISGDLLVTRTGSIGTMAVFRGDYVAIPSAYLIRLRFAAETDVDYVHLVLRSPYGQETMGLNTTKVAQPNINAKSLAAIKVPFPPIAEQHRIVAKVDELMGLCEQLETSLTTGVNTRHRLLGALLAEALAPVEDLVPDRAERAATHG